MTGWKEYKEQQLDQWIEQIRQQHDIPGMAVALAEQGDMVYARGFGCRDQEQGLAASENTIFGTASVTKSFTAAAITLLAQEGRLALGERVRTYLPEFTTGKALWDRAVTIQHFLTHSAGLPPSAARRYAVVRSMTEDPSAAVLQAQGKWDAYLDYPPIDSCEDLMQFWKDRPQRLLGPCGGQFSYSNDSYALLGCIVERVSGMPFSAFVEQRLLGPLGVERSFFSPERLGTYSDVTQLYMRDMEGSVIPAPQWTHAPAMLGSGYLKSTVTDLVRCASLYLDGSPLFNAQSRTNMIAPYIPCGRGTYYGHGLMVHPNYHGVTVVEHGGSQKGVSAAFGFVPERNVAAAVLTNIVEVPANRIWQAAVNLALDLPMEEPLSPEPVYQAREEELQRWVGAYRSDEDVSLEVVLKDGRAYLLTEGKETLIRPSGPATGAIAYRGGETGIQFVPGCDGRVAAVFYGYRLVRRVQ